jgi:hypothetical protein
MNARATNTSSGWTTAQEKGSAVTETYDHWPEAIAGAYPRARYSAGLTFDAYLAGWAKNRPDSPALVFADRTWTDTELDAEDETLAAYARSAWAEATGWFCNYPTARSSYCSGSRSIASARCPSTRCPPTEAPRYMVDLATPFDSAVERDPQIVKAGNLRILALP